MAVDKLVDSTQLDSDLTSVANAIRTKGGTSASLAFPADFVSAIQAIPTGTTPTGTKQISITANGTTTEDVAAYANAEITVDVQGGGGDTLAELCNGTLTRYSSLSVTAIKTAAFRGATFLGSVSIPNCEEISGGYTFNNTAITQITLPALVTRKTYGNFESCRSLQIVDIGGRLSGIKDAQFANCSSFETLIIRRIDKVPSLGQINVFNSSPFASNGTGGTLYVPSSLVSQYTQATNWSTILGYANNQILPIEGSVYENAYADGTPIT